MSIYFRFWENCKVFYKISNNEYDFLGPDQRYQQVLWVFGIDQYSFSESFIADVQQLRQLQVSMKFMKYSTSIPTSSTFRMDSDLSDVVFTDNLIKQHLSKLKPSASGSDSIFSF